MGIQKRPVRYLQTDPAWGKLPYAAPGEAATIGTAGCGPTCAAMVITAASGKRVTPKETGAWAVRHGYKAKNQGTYYSYFEPQLAAYDIRCRRVNSRSLYGSGDAPEHEAVKAALRAGHLIIACMGPGRWTKSGHYILLYGIGEDGSLLINDPASTAPERERGDPAVFAKQVKYYWDVTVPEREEKKMSKEEAMQLIMEKAHLSPKTVNFLDQYRYGDELIFKLARALK